MTSPVRSWSWSSSLVHNWFSIKQIETLAQSLSQSSLSVTVSQLVIQSVGRSILFTALNLKTFHFMWPPSMGPYLRGLWLGFRGWSEAGRLEIGGWCWGQCCGHKVCNFIDNIYFKCTQKPLNSMKFVAVYLQHKHTDSNIPGENVWSVLVWHVAAFNPGK